MVVWGADATQLFAVENFGSVDVLSTTSTATSLVGTVSSTAAQLPGTLQTLTYSTGRLYNDGGDVFDATTLNTQAVLPTTGLVTVDAANQTMFVASWNTSTDRLDITSYDQTTNAPRETITVWSTGPTGGGPGVPRRTVRWGVDGLAIVDVNGRLAVLWGPFVASGGTGSIVGTIPGTNPCCTQNPLQFSPTVNVTSIAANDIAWDSLHGLVLASIPATDPDHPDTIAVIDSSTGQVSSYVATADNPGALAVSDDGQYLYVGEPKTYQRFLLPGLTVDATYAQDASGSAQTTSPPLQITVRPGDPHTVTVLSMLLGGINNEAFYVYKDGVDLGIGGTRASWLQWSADGTTLYGSDGYNADYPTLWSTTFSTPQSFASFGTPFSYPIGENSMSVTGLNFTIEGGLFYSGSGAIYDPLSGGWPGSLPLATTADANSLLGNTFAVGALAIDTAHQRAYSATCIYYGVNSACGNALISAKLNTYTPIVVGQLPGVFGLASRLLELSPTSFVILTSANQVVFVSSPKFAL